MSLLVQGLPGAPGRARGRLLHLREARRSGSLDEILAEARAELQASRMALRASAPEERAHLDTMAALLLDPLLRRIAEAALRQGLSPDRALRAAGEACAATVRERPEPEAQHRAEELEALLNGLLTRPPQPPAEGSILVAESLSVERLLALLGPRGRGPLRALVLLRGGPTGHTCLLARRRGLPVVLGLAAHQLPEDQPAFIDGETGAVVIGRSAGLRGSLRRAPQVPAPPGGLRWLATVDRAEESGTARRLGAEGIGLLRGDGLLERSDAGLALRSLLRPWSGREVWLRLPDAPAHGPLGPRGARWLELDPARVTGWLRPILDAARAAPRVRLGLVLAMVDGPAPLEALRRMLAALGAPDLPLGAMIETPGAALQAGELAARAELLLVGGNDLLQFLVGADRDDPRLAALLDLDHPALWELLGRVAAAARRAGRPAHAAGLLAQDEDRGRRLQALGFHGLCLDLPTLRRWRATTNPGVDTANGHT